MKIVLLIFGAGVSFLFLALVFWPLERVFPAKASGCCGRIGGRIWGFSWANIYYGAGWSCGCYTHFEAGLMG